MWNRVLQFKSTKLHCLLLIVADNNLLVPEDGLQESYGERLYRKAHNIKTSSNGFILERINLDWMLGRSYLL